MAVKSAVPEAAVAGARDSAVVVLAGAACEDVAFRSKGSDTVVSAMGLMGLVGASGDVVVVPTPVGCEVTLHDAQVAVGGSGMACGWVDRVAVETELNRAQLSSADPGLCAVRLKRIECAPCPREASARTSSHDDGMCNSLQLIGHRLVYILSL